MNFIPIPGDGPEQVELINPVVGVPMEVEPGLIIVGMIQDTLSGRMPLIPILCVEHNIPILFSADFSFLFFGGPRF